MQPTRGRQEIFRPGGIYAVEFFLALQSYSREEEDNYETIREKSSFSRFLFVFQAFWNRPSETDDKHEIPPLRERGFFWSTSEWVTFWKATLAEQDSHEDEER